MVAPESGILVLLRWRMPPEMVWVPAENVVPPMTVGFESCSEVTLFQLKEVGSTAEPEEETEGSILTTVPNAATPAVMSEAVLLRTAPDSDTDVVPLRWTTPFSIG